ncbi:accessory gene regulator ArgB-like protein [Acetobacterium woodii]|uniref:Accessory gene regulator B n=1 Tax=Acetobacterium woodii (strain ATCC 29683 / DSM 1030 / JCM 2381 / KCTC 1655 / WB1) TaxID=931626 RepID=H6LJ08_ACEWD|nr:accessory gene regulator B family protein [Acetobacterium woodii]AFA47371.1 accessory gene regulator B [Acetobacterium woodii DSM 1030]
MLTLTKRLSASICQSLNITGDKREVVEYGMIALIQILVLIPAIIIIGSLTGTALSALIICFSASLLRKSSGGVHVSSINICTIMGITFCVGASVLIQYFLDSHVSINVLLAVVIISFLIALAVILTKAPVDTENKPIRTAKKKKRLRKEALFILAFYAGISVLLIYFSFNYRITTVYLWSILFGMMWQVLTLTQIGEKIIGGIDKKLCQIWKLARSSR